MKSRIFLAASLAANVVLVCAVNYLLIRILSLPDITQPAIIYPVEASRAAVEKPAAPDSSHPR